MSAGQRTGRDAGSSAPGGFGDLADFGEGSRVEVPVGAVAHGGHCVARIGGAGGPVVFVRHALPGERVVAEITEVRRGYLRADAVEVLSASPDRVEPPCPWARPGACGGCDLQHVAPAAQLDWKAAVVREQLTRLGGLTTERVEALDVRVLPLPTGTGTAPVEAGQPAAGPVGATTGPAGGGDLLGWRTRVRYAVDAVGRAGLLKHRSHEVVPIDRCRIAHAAVQHRPVLDRAWPETDFVEVVASSTGDVSVRAGAAAVGGAGLVGAGVTAGGDGSVRGEVPVGGAGLVGAGVTAGGEVPVGGDVPVRGDAAGGARTWDAVVDGTPVVREEVDGRTWSLDSRVFWQVHPAAPAALTRAVLDLLRPLPGETAWDLYGGAGLFAAALAGEVGVTGSVTLVESARAGADAARENLADLRQVRVVGATVEGALRRGTVRRPVDLVVLDPPRTGAGAEVVRAVTRSGARAAAYVACDPAALARDVRTFATRGWRLAALLAFDCFPMTRHVECVALLEPA